MLQVIGEKFITLHIIMHQWFGVVSSTQEKVSRLPVTLAPAEDSTLLVSQGTHPQQADTHTHRYTHFKNE